MSVYRDGTTHNALVGGTWRLDARRVWVWVTGVQQAPTPPPDMHKLIACPTCRARLDQTCRTKTGHTTTPHMSRLVPRFCGCGVILETKKRYCDQCRTMTNRANRRAWRNRQKEAA